jgi:hypothetical protein
MKVTVVLLLQYQSADNLMNDPFLSSVYGSIIDLLNQ